MTVSAAKEWADFLVKLGYNSTKKYITDYIIAHNMSSDDAWNYFIEQRSLVKEAANINRFYSADDVESYFREVSYIKMRGTYPRRHNGRSFVVPRLKTMKEIQQEKENATPSSNGVQEADIAIATTDMVGKSVFHAIFGQGTIADVTNDGYIVVDFENCERKVLSYRVSIEKGLISIVR
jgi:hypothetical protein